MRCDESSVSLPFGASKSDALLTFDTPKRFKLRILKRIVDRVRGRARAKETPIGWMPHYEDLDWTGLDFPKEDFERLQKVERLAWRLEIIGHEELFLDLHEGLPKEMLYERELLICRM